MNNFYTYIYLNPLKPGRYTYGSFVSFLYEPFYVGKGKGNRQYDHLNENKNTSYNKHKYYTIQKILEQKYKPLIIKIINDIESKCSLCYEKFLISLIGRKDLNKGPLTNMSYGGDGSNSESYSKLCREKMSEFNKNRIVSNTTKEKHSISSKGRIWIHNEILNKNKFIKLEDLLNYSDWEKGLSKKSKNKMSESKIGTKRSIDTIEKIRVNNAVSNGENHHNFNKIYIFNNELKHNKLIKKDELEYYINNGWKKGMLKGEKLNVRYS